MPLACYVAHAAHGGVATEVAGTFRVSGSNKRMRELQAAFETPPTVRIMLGTHRSGVLTEPLVWQTPQMGERELYDTRCRECVPTIPHPDARTCAVTPRSASVRLRSEQEPVIPHDMYHLVSSPSHRYTTLD